MMYDLGYVIHKIWCMIPEIWYMRYETWDNIWCMIEWYMRYMWDVWYMISSLWFFFIDLTSVILQVGLNTLFGVSCLDHIYIYMHYHVGCFLCVFVLLRFALQIRGCGFSGDPEGVCSFVCLFICVFVCLVVCVEKKVFVFNMQLWWLDQNFTQFASEALQQAT